MVRIVIDAGHSLNTAGKRTPDDEREWSFNDKVARAAIARLNTYEGVAILRVDDPTGKTDVSLSARTNRANAWKADVFVSLHHNAMTGKWGAHGGVETFTFNGAGANPASPRIAAEVNPRVVTAMGLRNRGVKKANFHVLREAHAPAILVEGGFMDSTTDIGALRDDVRLKAQGEAVADGLAAYYGLKVRSKVEQSPMPVDKPAPAKKPAPVAKPKPAESLVVDGYFGPLTIRALQRYFGTTVDGVISRPSNVIRALQRVLGVAQDGYFGPLTIRALQRRFGTIQDGVISKPSMAIRELQRRLNSGKL